jgi:hypothetical protein
MNASQVYQQATFFQFSEGNMVAVEPAIGISFGYFCLFFGMALFLYHHQSIVLW